MGGLRMGRRKRRGDTNNNSNEGGGVPDDVRSTCGMSVTSVTYDPHEMTTTSTTGFETTTSRAGEPIATWNPFAWWRLSKKERRRKCLSRVAVLMILVLLAAGVSSLLYTILANKERQRFEEQFDFDSKYIFESFGQSLHYTLGSADAFVTKLVAYARYSNSTWPLVSLPKFCLEATKMLRMSNAFNMGIAPLVPANKREEWQKYASENNGWIDDCLDIQEGDSGYYGPIVRHYNTSYEIFGIRGPHLNASWCLSAGSYDDEECFFQPAWQKTPVVPHAGARFPYNLDAHGHPVLTRAVMHSYQTKQAVVAGYGNVFDLSEPKKRQQAKKAQKWIQQFIRPDDDASVPTGSIAYPIVDTFDSVRVDSREADERVVGALTFAIRWIELIRDVLPVNSPGLILVFAQADCGPPFSYELNEGEARYLGIGDLHDTIYDSWAHTANMADLMGEDFSSKASLYTGLRLSSDYCPKTLTLYPSKTMEYTYRTPMPVLFATIAALLVVVTALVFFTYDFCQSRRQKKVMKQVLPKMPSTKKLLSDSSHHRRPATIGPTEDGLVAGRYNATTVMLADLAGFGDWSATRAPGEVFELLEMLYGAFDAIAVKHKVFKIESIGDRYVAVTGMPDRQKDHAVRMTKFAQACLTELKRLNSSLGDKFGATADQLGLRIGLHSGSIRATVLPGDTARVRLLGGAVSLANQMVSTGSPDKIHVSQATANEITVSGYRDWLTRRVENVLSASSSSLLEGGETHTYWVVVPADALRISTHSKSSSDLSKSKDPLAPASSHGNLLKSNRPKLGDMAKMHSAMGFGSGHHPIRGRGVNPFSSSGSSLRISRDPLPSVSCHVPATSGLFADEARSKPKRVATGGLDEGSLHGSLHGSPFHEPDTRGVSLLENSGVSFADEDFMDEEHDEVSLEFATGDADELEEPQVVVEQEDITESSHGDTGAQMGGQYLTRTKSTPLHGAELA